MTQSPVSSKFWLRLGISVFLYWTIIGSYYYYFYRVPATSDPGTFYSEFKDINLNITNHELKSILFEGTGSSFDKMVVGSAFMRYKLDPSANGIFSRYITDYQDGLWNVPDSKIWREVISQFQDNWTVKRSNFIKSGTKGNSPVLLRTNQKQFVLQFKNTSTFEVGTVLDALVVVPDDGILDTPAHVLCFFEGVVQPLELVAKWDIEPQITNRQKVALLRLDFSLEYEWFIPHRKLQHIIINGVSVDRWEIVGVRSSDPKS